MPVIWFARLDLVIFIGLLWQICGFSFGPFYWFDLLCFGLICLAGMIWLGWYWFANIKLAASLCILTMMKKREGFNPLSVQLKGESPLNFQLHFITASPIAIELLIIVPN